MPVIYDAIRVAVVGEALQQQIVNVFHVAGSSKPVVDVAGDVGLAYANAFKPLLSSQYSFGHASGIDMNAANGEIGQVDLATFEVGGAPDTPEIGLAAVIRWVSTASGRGIRTGRTFFGPCSGYTSGTGGLEVAPSFRIQLTNSALDFVDEVNSLTGGAISLVHGLSSGGGIVVAPILSASVASKSGHLDSRRN